MFLYGVSMLYFHGEYRNALLWGDEIIQRPTQNSQHHVCKLQETVAPLVILGSFKELNLSYHNSETILFTIHPYYGNLNWVPYQQPRIWDHNILHSKEAPTVSERDQDAILTRTPLRSDDRFG